MSYSQLVRDSNTNAVLNTDVAALNKYKKERELYRKVNSLAQELETIKECLKSVCEKLEKIESK